MGELIIRISDSGAVRVFVDEVQVGLIQEMTVTAGVGDQTPQVAVRFPSTSTLGSDKDSTVYQKVVESIERNEALIRSIPFVRVVGGDSVPSESEIVKFFSDAGEDGGGRKLYQVMQKDDSWYERTHDFVQWILPTRRRSKYEPGAPTLTDDDVRAFQARRDLSEKYLFAVDRMESFLQLDRMRPTWVRRLDHNHKRLSRLLESLVDLGFRDRARRVFDRVSKIVQENPGVIPEETVSIWRAASGGK